MNQNPTENSTPNNKENFLYGVFLFLLIFSLLFLIIVILKNIYYKYFRKRYESSQKLKKTEEIKSIYDDKFGIIDNEHVNIHDKSMIKEFLESNVDFKKKDIKKDDKNFNYISAKNVFNIEGEESEYHYDNSKKYSNRENISETCENEEEMGQFSQEIEMGNEELKNEKNESSMLNVMN